VVIWEACSGIGGKRLKPLLAEAVYRLKPFDQLRLWEKSANS
jgi:hypothetical protein